VKFYSTLLMLLLVQTDLVHAQSTADQPIVQRGELVSLKVIPRSRTFEFYLVGNKGAVIEFDKAGLTASLLVGQNRRNLTLRKQLGYFTLDKSSLHANETNILNIQAELNGKSESFDLNLQR